MNTQSLLPAGGTAAFATPLRLGQYNLARRDRYEAAMRGIFERRYYTNQGPLARAFEEQLQTFLNVRHAICVTNATIGLMMASEALGAAGCALVPGIRNVALDHALHWCRVEPVYCDVDAASGHLDMHALERNADLRGVDVIVGANLWGGACEVSALAEFAQAHDIALMFDSSHAFGCLTSGKRIGCFGAIEVLSFNPVDIVNAAGGACVATDDDELAARLRNIRSSYGAGRPVAVVKTSNGRMSEAQAALGLLGLEDFDARRAHNRILFDAYCSGLRTVAGMRVVEPASVTESNHQALVCAMDADLTRVSRDTLIAELAARNVEARAVCANDGIERAHGARLDGSLSVASSWLMLPLGAHVDEHAVARVCALIEEILATSRPGKGGAV